MSKYGIFFETNKKKTSITQNIVQRLTFVVNMKTYHTIVIGAGAAGLLAAGRAAQIGEKVLLIERNERPGRKLLITGKGRCNITNNASLDEYLKKVFPRPRFLKHAFKKFFTTEIIALLNENGVETMVERGDRVFPVSEKSKDVVDGLVNWAKTNGVNFEYNQRVESIIVNDGKVGGLIANLNGKPITYHCKKVVIATGGKSYPATGSTGDGYKLASEVGHTIVKPMPSLVPLETSCEKAMRMQGLSLKNVNASLWVDGKKLASEFGEMLFTHFGLSGPIILTLSRLVVKALNHSSRVEIIVDLKPALDDAKLDKRLLRDIDEQGQKLAENLMRQWMPSAMVPIFMELTKIEPNTSANQISAQQRKKIRVLLKNLPFSISRPRSFKEAVVTSGGVSLDEVNSSTMESKLVKGLFFAGEVLDLDADTGGYNLQIAWSTGWLAGGQ